MTKKKMAKKQPAKKPVRELSLKTLRAVVGGARPGEDAQK